MSDDYSKQNYDYDYVLTIMIISKVDLLLVHSSASSVSSASSAREPSRMADVIAGHYGQDVWKIGWQNFVAQQLESSQVVASANMTKINKYLKRKSYKNLCIYHLIMRIKLIN